MATPLDGPELVGREADLAQLAGTIHGICEGTSRTLIISGDPGVGKTTLVGRACGAAPPEVLILAGGALPLGAVDVPFLALRSVLRTADVRTGLTVSPPALSGDARPDVLILIDEWLTALSRTKPVILMIDDLQWADQSTLDILMYVVAGPENRRLGVIGTVRTDAAGAGGQLQRWLADVARLPRVDLHWLAPLDRPDTEAQLGGLLGAPPRRSLVHDVFARSAGNPYFNRLLVSGLPADAAHLPAGFPPDLSSAVLRSWRELPAGARELTQIMAIGGRPATGSELRAVAGAAANPNAFLPLLHTTVEAGVVDLAPDGTFWFHHPIMAEILEQGLDAGERRRWHAAFAAAGEQKLMAGSGPPAAAVALADHYAQADLPAEAYRWALAAAGLAAEDGSFSDALRLLRRAVQLRAALTGAEERPRDLWDRLRGAAREAGALPTELEAIEVLLASMDASAEPLEVSHLMVRRMHLQFSTGRTFFPMADILDAVRLSAAAPESWQHALALAELAHAGMWHNEPGVEAIAAHALAVARKSGDHRALPYAASAAAIAEIKAGRPEVGLPLASEAAAAAMQARDFWAYVHATYWTGNARDPWTSEAYADLLRRARQEMQEQGAPHAYIAKVAADEAASYLAIGEWRKCRSALRIVLSFDPGPMGDVSARLTAARLAQLQGRKDEAAVHLARAQELYPGNSGYLNLDFEAVRAEVYVAAGRPDEAFVAALTGATNPGPPPTMCEWLLPLAARALADQVQRAKDAGNRTADLLAAAKELEQRFPGVLHETLDDSESYSRQVAAFELLYASELGRVRNEPGGSAAWASTADAFKEAGLPWEEAYACRRAVEALVLQGHHRSPRAADFLRRGLSLAADLEAVPIQSALRRLATQARIPLSPVVSGADGHEVRLPGLTARELEVLRYIMAGRTYAEIARGLTISEKTVSSHVSNLLRKTGATNRVDLARLASEAQLLAGEAPVRGGFG